MRESAIEAYLVREVAKRGGIAEKFSSPGRRNVPDRIVTWPNGVVEFVEVKAPGKKPTPGQARDHKRRRAMFHTVIVVDSYADVLRYVGGLKTRLDVQMREAWWAVKKQQDANGS